MTGLDSASRALSESTNSGGSLALRLTLHLGWDNCSDTPVRGLNDAGVALICLFLLWRLQYLFDVSRQTVVTYDDTYSLADKASYAKSAGMAGCFTWSLDQVPYPFCRTYNRSWRCLTWELLG